MAKFLITYDLHNRREYGDLYRTLGALKAVRLAASVWMANLTGPAPAVRDIIARSLDSDDTLAVIELKPGSDWATKRVGAAPTGWLSAYIAPAEYHLT